jgi:RNA polymerase-binding transcription factor DksA
MEGQAAAVPTRSTDGERPCVTRADLDRVEAELVGVEQALSRLDDATYGTCQRCGVRLDDELLAAEPLALRCPDHP